MTRDDFRGWIAYYNLEPWGETRADLRAGIVAAAVRNGLRAKGTRSFKPVDFMPQFGPREVDEDGITNRVLAWARAFKAQIDRRKKQ